tara:strand:- start:116 stop:259 length:144 start_codon:yes stop_codon:yes gene_type:complete
MPVVVIEPEFVMGLLTPVAFTALTPAVVIEPLPVMVQMGSQRKGYLN